MNIFWIKYKMNNKHVIRVSLLLLLIVATSILGSTSTKLNEHYNDKVDTVPITVQNVNLSSYKGTKDDRALS